MEDSSYSQEFDEGDEVSHKAAGQSQEVSDEQSSEERYVPTHAEARGGSMLGSGPRAPLGKIMYASDLLKEMAAASAESGVRAPASVNGAQSPPASPNSPSGVRSSSPASTSEQDTSELSSPVERSGAETGSDAHSDGSVRQQVPSQARAEQRQWFPPAPAPAAPAGSGWAADARRFAYASSASRFQQLAAPASLEDLALSTTLGLHRPRFAALAAGTVLAPPPPPTVAAGAPQRSRGASPARVAEMGSGGGGSSGGPSGAAGAAGVTFAGRSRGDSTAAASGLQRAVSHMSDGALLDILLSAAAVGAGGHGTAAHSSRRGASAEAATLRSLQASSAVAAASQQRGMGPASSGAPSSAAATAGAGGSFVAGGRRRLQPAALQREAREYLIAHPQEALGPARRAAEGGGAQAAADQLRSGQSRHCAGSADVGDSGGGSDDEEEDGEGDGEADAAEDEADAARAGPRAGRAADAGLRSRWGAHFDAVYTGMTLGLSALAVSAALTEAGAAPDAAGRAFSEAAAAAPGSGSGAVRRAGDSGVGGDLPGWTDVRGAAGSSGAAGEEDGGGVGEGDLVPAPVFEQLVQHAARKLTQLPPPPPASAAAAASRHAAGESPAERLRVAEALLRSLQDMLTDAGVVTLLREATARRLRVD